MRSARMAGLDGSAEAPGGRGAAAAPSIGRIGNDARLDNKQNVFDDPAAAARWLATSGWTDAAQALDFEQLERRPSSASITQHPELFGRRGGGGWMDMLRFHRFTIGWGWTFDFGLLRRLRRVPERSTRTRRCNIRAGTMTPTFVTSPATTTNCAGPPRSVYGGGPGGSGAGDGSVIGAASTPMWGTGSQARPQAHG